MWCVIVETKYAGQTGPVRHLAVMAEDDKVTGTRA